MSTTTTGFSVGMTVYMERYPEDRNTKGEPLGAYYSGEWVILGVGCNTITCVRLDAVYRAQDQQTFSLIGADRWRVIAKGHSPRTVGDCKWILNECEEVLSGRKKAQWVEYVYTNARANARRILEGVAPATPVPSTNQTGVGIVVPPTGSWLVRDGVTVELPKGSTVSIVV